MWQALHFEFMRNALIAGTMVSIICGVVGTLVVVNRLVFYLEGLRMQLMEELAWPFISGFPPDFLLQALHRQLLL